MADFPSSNAVEQETASQPVYLPAMGGSKGGAEVAMHEAGLEGMGKHFQENAGVEKASQKASGGRKNTDKVGKVHSCQAVLKYSLKSNLTVL